MKRIFLLVLTIFSLFCLVGCKTSKNTKEDFLKKISTVEGYKVDGILETFFENGRKQSEFEVCYKKNDYYKVVLQSIENSDKQIILKNDDGVFVLVPSVNKNFKIKSTWPSNASYPYLLQSLAQDIANDSDQIVTENEATYTIQTKTKMHTEADAITQKIIFSKENNLPTEVLIYENDGDLFMRCVYKNINLNCDINNDEFNVDKSMTTAYLSYGEEGLVFNNRHFNLPSYCPDGLVLKSNENVKKGEEARAVMLFGGNSNLTIIQELINYKKEMTTLSENGEVIMVMGNVGIINDNYIKFVYEGIEYTIASNNLSKNELINVSSSYMQIENK